MNRIREMEYNERTGQGRRNPFARAAAQGFETDDQNTLLSVQPSSTDMQSVFSGSSTIGDYERLGFVNRCPRFTSGRTVTFASIMLSKGFFAWEDEKSLNMFIENRRKLEKCLEEGGGWPLFHFVSVGFKSYFNKNVPVNKIHKFKVVDNDKVCEMKEPVKELLHKNKYQSLYKVEFCCIYRTVNNKAERIEHRFVFDREDGTKYTITMVNSTGRKNVDFQIYEPTTQTTLNARWYGTTGYTSVFGSNDFKLKVLDDDVPHLLTHSAEDARNSADYASRSGTRPVSRMPVWGVYARATSLLPIPKRRVLKLATFEVAEVEQTETVPFITEVLTCMCMYLHELESRKERRTPLAPSTGMTFMEFM